jgi:hypothetical protein
MHLETPLRLAEIRIDDLRRTAPHHRFPTAPRTSTRARWTRRTS